MRKLTQKDDISAFIKLNRLYYNGDGSPVMVKMVEYSYPADTWLIDTCGNGPRSLNSEGFYSYMLVAEEKDSIGLMMLGASSIERHIKQMGAEFQKMSNQIKEAIQMKKQEIELKEGMTARVEGCKVIIETKDAKFKAGDFVTCEENEFGNKWIMIWNGIDGRLTNEFCGFSVNHQRLDMGGCSCSSTETFRTSTREERNTLISALADEGKRWDAEKMQIVDIEWKPTDGEFVTHKDGWMHIHRTTDAKGEMKYYVAVSPIGKIENPDYITSFIGYERELRGPATTAEIQKFHQLLERSGKKWNPDTKKVEDLEWKPKVGEIVKSQKNGGIMFIYSGVINVDFSSHTGFGNLYFSVERSDISIGGERMCSDVYETTWDDRCKFFSALTKSGYKWNAKKLKLTKVEKKWSPVDGDFVYMPETERLYESIFIYKNSDNYYASMNKRRGVAWVSSETCVDKPTRPATDSERKQLIDALAKAGKRWNAELKRIEDLKPEYKEGDFITRDDGAIVIYKNKVNDKYFDHAYWGGMSAIINENAFANESTVMRLSTEEEKQKMISELYKAGKVWNASKKRIENIEEAPVEMTMEQVCEKLGMNVKIIKK